MSNINSLNKQYGSCRAALGLFGQVYATTGQLAYFADIASDIAREFFRDPIGLTGCKTRDVQSLEVAMQLSTHLQQTHAQPRNTESLIRRLSERFFSSYEQNSAFLMRLTKALDKELGEAFAQQEQSLLQQAVEKRVPVRVDGFSKFLRKTFPTLGEGEGKVYPCKTVHVVTNENNYKASQDLLAKQVGEGDFVHIGVSAWHNFDLIVSGKATRAVLFDIQPAVQKFIHTSLFLLRTCATRKEFCKKMCEEIAKNADLRCNLFFDENFKTEEEAFNDQLQREGSFLSTDKGYQKIRQMALKDKIVLLSLNASDTDSMDRLAKIISQNTAGVSCAYWSNVCDYVENKDTFFQKVVEAFIHNNDTVVVVANSHLVQKALLGRECRGKAAEMFA